MLLEIFEFPSNSQVMLTLPPGNPFLRTTFSKGRHCKDQTDQVGARQDNDRRRQASRVDAGGWTTSPDQDCPILEVTMGQDVSAQQMHLAQPELSDFTHSLSGSYPEIKTEPPGRQREHTGV